MRGTSFLWKLVPLLILSQVLLKALQGNKKCILVLLMIWPDISLLISRSVHYKLERSFFPEVKIIMSSAKLKWLI